jgi:hypothetical protein
MSFALSSFRRASDAFIRRWTEPRRRQDEFRGRPESTPRLEPLEDRRLLSYTITNLGWLGGTVSVPLTVDNHGEVVGFAYTAGN